MLSISAPVSSVERALRPAPETRPSPGDCSYQAADFEHRISAEKARPPRPSRGKGMELSLELPDDMRPGATRPRRRSARRVLDSEKSSSFPISKPYLIFGGVVLGLIVLIVYLNRFY